MNPNHPKGRFNPYPACKPSGVPWLGDVPGHWEMRRLRTVADVINGATPSTNNAELWDGDIPWITPDDLGQLSGSYIAEGSRSITEVGYRSCATTIAPPGSVAISTRAPIGHIGILLRHGCVNQGCRLLVPKKNIQSKFLYYQLSSAQFELQSLGQGSTFMELSRGKLADFAIPLPPLPEQAAIVRYLDHADRRIQRYVSGKERLIALLEEEKQAIINQAVTSGLDPNVPLKPSGVQWLGDVPAHWGMRRLKTICDMQSGEGITSETIEPVGPYPVYGGNGIRGYSDNYTHEGEFALIGRQGALCGNVHLARGRFWASEHAVVASLYPGHDLDWFEAALMVMDLNQYSIAAAQPGLAVERVMNLWLGVPPLEEQSRIAQSLRKYNDGLDKAVAAARRQIELLREYRTCLIADVVTGKLDVREAAAQLPEEGRWN